MLTKGLFLVAILGLMAAPALALDAAPVAAPKLADTTNEKSREFLGLALAFGLAIAALAGAFSQSNAIAKSVDAVARQPEAGARIQGMMIIGLALIETLVIYMLLICFMWGGKLDPLK